jgi:glyoxylase I family protein
MPSLTGFHHVALTVTDVARSARWYCELLGMEEVWSGDDDSVSFRVLAHPATGTVLGLRQYAAGPGDRFDELRTGLDHAAFGVSSADELAAWEDVLRVSDIPFTPATVTPIGTVIVFRDPDDIQLEFWLPS